MTEDRDSKLPEPGQFPPTTVAMYSGGIDSTTLLYLLRSRESTKRLRAVTINYGQLDFEQAYGAVNRISTDLNIPVQLIDVPNLSRSVAGFIEESHDGYRILQTEHHTPGTSSGDDDEITIPKDPGASCMTTSMAGVYAYQIGYHAIAEGVNKEDLETYTLRTRIHSFLREALAVDGTKFTVFAPFIDMTRVEVMELGAELGVPFERTWSCWGQLVRHCGQCRGCGNRKRRFSEAGIEDVTSYIN